MFSLAFAKNNKSFELPQCFQQPENSYKCIESILLLEILPNSTSFVFIRLFSLIHVAYEELVKHWNRLLWNLHPLEAFKSRLETQLTGLA